MEKVMNIFESVKCSVTARQAAEYYGIKVNRNGMACCPFHPDKTPSLKLDNRYHCFGCQADGDVIDLVGNLFGLDPKSSAEKIASDFGIVIETQNSQKKTRKKKDTDFSKTGKKVGTKELYEEYLEMENYCRRVLSDYLQKLYEWEKLYAPSIGQDWDSFHPLLLESLQNKSYTEYILDEVLGKDPIEIRAMYVRDHWEEVKRLDERLSGNIRRDGSTA